MLYILLRYVVRYRLNVVRDNVNKSFPDKTDKEKEVIVNNFFRHFCRQSFESLHFFFISEKAIKRKFIFDNLDILEDFAKSGRNVTVVLGHYGNWDWLASIPLWSDHFISATLYKRINNKFFNKIFLQIRSRFGTHCIEKKMALRGLIELNKESKPNVVAYLADQSSRKPEYWIDFLNQPTSVLSGWATIARKFNTPVVYLSIKQEKKGHYIAHCETITENPKSMSELELVKQFMSRLEKDIIESPELWLWSHRRWKYHLPVGKQIQ